MPVELMNPETLPRPEGYAQLSISSGTRLVQVAGQVARTADGGQVGAGDLAAQSDQAFGNVFHALAAAGATFADVAKLTIYVVDHRPEKAGLVVEGAIRAAGRLGFDPVRPVTLIGVTALGEPDLLVEVEAMAVLP